MSFIYLPYLSLSFSFSNCFLLVFTPFASISWPCTPCLFLGYQQYIFSFLQVVGYFLIMVIHFFLRFPPYFESLFFLSSHYPILHFLCVCIYTLDLYIKKFWVHRNIYPDFYLVCRNIF